MESIKIESPKRNAVIIEVMAGSGDIVFSVECKDIELEEELVKLAKHLRSQSEI